MNHLITIHPDIQSGAPVFYNTRVPVKNLFDYLKGGHTVDEFIEDFPSVKREQALGVQKSSTEINYSIFVD
ncbi:DUF433 domain-containing protein [Runella sp.]|jgi:uncharacterized protein (DUF433 family)|uniref:DUF433 domain-containing protein n=1 Tax=Runella sp. TaxID=1960881 RepID=UPI00261BADD7|nr:DUF433 domain-containing protein [Runella sp.]